MSKFNPFSIFRKGSFSDGCLRKRCGAGPTKEAARRAERIASCVA